MMRSGGPSRLGLCLALVAGAFLAALSVGFAAGDLERFVGVYVGRAVEMGGEGPPREERDIDLVITPKGKDGLVLAWTNVTLVDGRRDVPGVRRRADEMWLIPAAGHDLFLARAPYNPFAETAPPRPLKGDPLRWAALSGDTLRTYSLLILEDGRYELQTYVRTLTPDGMRLDWRRVIDGITIRTMTGRATRAE